MDATKNNAINTTAETTSVHTNRTRKYPGATHGNSLAAAKRFGHELKRHRLNKGYRFLASLSEASGISQGYLSQVEHGIRSDKRSPVFMSDDKMDIISKLLDWPKQEMYETLGRVPQDDSIFAVSPGRLQDEFSKLTEDDKLRVLKELMATMAVPKKQ